MGDELEPGADSDAGVIEDTPASVDQSLRAANPTGSTVEERHALERARARLLQRQRAVMIDRYILLDRLGAGGRGVVYKAFDPSLERSVAIKLLAPGAVGEDEQLGQARLVREARAIAQLSHPNVIAVHDVGTYDPEAVPGAGSSTGREGVFVVMELVQGRTLDAWQREEERRWRDVQTVFLDAGRGLAAAHERGLIHRDFKPANVMVGDDGRVRVLDFGLARPLSPLSSDSAPSDGADVDVEGTAADPSGTELATPLTKAGMVMGTPVYMAPEQHRGQELDARVDQYAFCVALYEALFGHRPFAGRTVRDLVRAKKKGPGARPSTTVPDRLWRVVQRGLQPRPEDRYPSMGELLRELSRDPHRMRSRLLGLAGVGLVVTVTAMGSLWWEGRDARVCRGRASELAPVWGEDTAARAREAFEHSGLPFAEDAWRFVRAELDAHAIAWARARRANCEESRAGRPGAAKGELCLDLRRSELEVVIHALVDADPKTVAESVELVSGLVDVEACRDVNAVDNLPVVEGQARDQILSDGANLMRARALSSLERWDDAERLALAALASARDRGDARVEAQAHLVLAPLSRRRAGDDWVRLREHLYGAWGAAARAGDEHTVVEAMIRTAGHLGRDMSQWPQAAGILEVARQRIARMGPSPLLQVRLRELETELAFHRGDYRGALAASRDAVALLETAVGTRHPKLVAPLMSIGRVHIQLGEFDEGLAEYQRALEIVESSLGKRHPLSIGPLFGLSNVAWGKGDPRAALEPAREALEVAQAVYGDRDIFEHAHLLIRIGDLHTALGEPEIGVGYHRRALAAREASLPADHVAVTYVLGHLAASLSSAEKYDEALEQIDRAVELDRGVGDDARTSLSLRKRARIYERLERVDAAMRDYEEVLKLKDPAATEEARGGVARLLLLGGDRTGAREQIESVLAGMGDLQDTDARLAEARFVLAQALEVEDPPRARDLAEQARLAFAGIAGSPELQRIDAWLSRAP